MPGILQLLALVLDIFSRAGGPEKLKDWNAQKIAELTVIRDGLTGPNEPFPKG